MGKRRKQETLIAVLIPALAFVLMSALVLALWEEHDPTGTENRTAVQAEQGETETEKRRVEPILVIETQAAGTQEGAEETE
ncbi:MAG: hypothetical protein SOZ59_03005 [Candidatus Limivivens sp.]|nr:hypothetical protein [Candidatus Limivivens sp.]